MSCSLQDGRLVDGAAAAIVSAGVMVGFVEAISSP